MKNGGGGFSKALLVLSPVDVDCYIDYPGLVSSLRSFLSI